MNNPIVLLNEARLRIERAGTVQEVKEYRDQAEAIRQYAQQRDCSLAIVNNAAEIKLRAERRLGELIPTQVRRGGAPKSQSVTLEDLGVSRVESSRWQAEASVPEETFEEFLARQRDRGEEITQAGLLRIAKDLRREEVWNERENLALQLPDREYQVLLVDPPWSYRNIAIRGGAANHYPTMSTDELAAIPVGDYAAADSVLFLWSTNPLIPDALRVLEAWGFEDKTKITWIKPHFGTGFFVRSQDEPLLIGTRGSIPPRKVLSSVITASKGRHSAKPPEVYERIEHMYPNLKRVELFARGSRAGWDAWGNELRAVCPDGAPDVPRNNRGETPSPHRPNVTSCRPNVTDLPTQTPRSQSQRH